jgi:hypothetical protein
MVTKEGHVQLPITLTEAYRKSAQALTIVGAWITKEDQSSGRIEARRGMSFTSWGENLVVEISGGDNAVYVAVTSSSSWPLTLADWGKNQSNVDRVLDWLRHSAG